MEGSAAAYIEVTVTELSSQGHEEGAFAGAWGPQQQCHPARVDAAVEAIENGELALIGLHQLQVL